MRSTAGDIRNVVAQLLDVGRSVSACMIDCLRRRAIACARGATHGLILEGEEALCAPATGKTALRLFCSSHCPAENKINPHFAGKIWMLLAPVSVRTCRSISLTVSTRLRTSKWCDERKWSRCRLAGRPTAELAFQPF